MDPKVGNALQKVLDANETPILILQTGWKPNYGTPTLWLAMTNQRLILFSTLRGGKIFKQSCFADINSVTWDLKDRVLKILFRDTELADWSFPLLPSVADETICALVRMTKERVTA